MHGDQHALHSTLASRPRPDCVTNQPLAGGDAVGPDRAGDAREKHLGLRITTWNANSIRLRESALRRIVSEIRPDVLCLQEIKVEDDRFPADLCRELGFTHLHVHGQQAYHGVALLSKLPLEQCHTRWWCRIEHSRHAICTLPGGLELQNFCIPARAVQRRGRHSLAIAALS